MATTKERAARNVIPETEMCKDDSAGSDLSELVLAVRRGEALLPGPGKDLYALILHALSGRGFTFADWCRSESVGESTARYAVYGLSDTAAAREIRGRAIRAAGLERSVTAA